MPRDIPVGNGQMLVNFDAQYRIRDLYFPHVGEENHGGGPCRFGVWAELPGSKQGCDDRRKQRLFWSDDGWDITLGYESNTLASDVTMRHDALKVEMTCTDVVDFHRPVLVRRIEIQNLASEPREVRLFHHHNFHLYGSAIGDTAYYDPQLRSLIHYRKNRYIMSAFYANGEQQIDEYATGTAGFHGAEGTWRDAEDGHLGNNSIAQGAVDSTMMINVQLPAAAGEGRGASGVRVVYLVIGCGHEYDDLDEIHRFLHTHGPQGVIDRTTAYWRLWLAATRTEMMTSPQTGLSDRVVDLFKRSLLIMRTQIDNSGAIIAANDSDIMQFSRDTYSYLWPRDGAFVADAIDAAGFPDVARSFFSLSAKLLTDGGYFLHKYNPDGSAASSWHPWVADGKPQLPIQEDETALVLWALWRHYVRYRDIEFARPMWIRLIQPAADFLVRYRDPDTHLPLPSYDLWEERWGVHAFTVASVYGGLKAAWQFAICFGDTRRAEAYLKAADEVHEAFCEHLWSPQLDRFVRRIVPSDAKRTSRFLADIVAGRSPRSENDSYSFNQEGLSGGSPIRPDFASINPYPNNVLNGNGHTSTPPNGTTHGHPPTTPTFPRIGLEHDPSSIIHDPSSASVAFDIDPAIDSSMYAIFAMGLLPVGDERVTKTMDAIKDRLWVKTQVGGYARYEEDYYHRVTDQTDQVPGNPWFICTLWMADYLIAKAGNIDELQQATTLLDWVADHALPSGVLAEQVHPRTNAPLSVSPLTWSHATVVSTLVKYLDKLNDMSACPTCGQPNLCHLPHTTPTPRHAMLHRPAMRAVAEPA